MDFSGGILIYSLWDGYKQKDEMKGFLSKCEEMGLRIINLHTTGHADANTIKKLISTVKPSLIIPVHTENAKWFQDLYKDKVSNNFEVEI